MASEMTTPHRYPATSEEIIHPDPLDVTRLKAALGLTIEEFAAATNRSPRSAARWLAAEGTAPMGGTAARSLRRLAYLAFLLDDVIGATQIGDWLRTPNPGFRGAAPLDLVISGRIEDVIAVLELLAEGTPA